MTRIEAARLGAMGTKALRAWVIAFNAEGPDGLINAPPPGRPSKLSTQQKHDIAELVEAGPDPERDGVVRWRRIDLKQVIRDRYDVDLDDTSVGRLLKEQGFAHISARPQHPRQASDAIERFKIRTARPNHPDR